MKFSSKQHTNRFFLKIDVTIPDHSKSNTPISVFPCNQVEKDSARFALFSWYFLLHFVQSSTVFWDDLLIKVGKIWVWPNPKGG